MLVPNFRHWTQLPQSFTSLSDHKCPGAPEHQHQHQHQHSVPVHQPQQQQQHPQEEERRYDWQITPPPPPQNAFARRRPDSPVDGLGDLDAVEESPAADTTAAAPAPELVLELEDSLEDLPAASGRTVGAEEAELEVEPPGPRIVSFSFGAGSSGALAAQVRSAREEMGDAWRPPSAVDGQGRRQNEGGGQGRGEGEGVTGRSAAAADHYVEEDEEEEGEEGEEDVAAMAGSRRLAEVQEEEAVRWSVEEQEEQEVREVMAAAAAALDRVKALSPPPPETLVRDSFSELDGLDADEESFWWEKKQRHQQQQLQQQQQQPEQSAAGSPVIRGDSGLAAARAERSAAEAAVAAVAAATEAMERVTGRAHGSGRGGAGRGLHSSPFPLNLSLPCPFPLKLSLPCPPYNPN